MCREGTMADMNELIKNGDLEGVQRAVEQDKRLLDVVCTPKGHTPLMWSLNPEIGDHVDIAEFLINAGAALDAQNDKGWTALMIACRYEKATIADILIEKGAHLNFQDKKGSTALMFACRQDMADTARLLIENRADLDHQDKTGSTALMFASRFNQPATAQLLIEKGAKRDLCNNDGWTALMFACRFSQPETAQLLIQKGAKLNAQDKEGWSALMYACRYAQPETAQMIIRKGAKLDLQDNEGWTALMFASILDPPETAALLVQKGAKVNLQKQGGWTALMLAIRYDHPATAEMLIQKGAKLNITDEGGTTALIYACRYKQPAAAKLMIEKGAKLDLQGKQGYTALCLACRYEQPETALLLIEKGAKIDLQNDDGWNALMLAFRHHHPEVAEVLIDKGARVNPQDVDGNSALMYACGSLEGSKHTSQEHLRAIQKLWAAGASSHMRSKSGLDAVTMARNNRRSDVVDFLDFVMKSDVAEALITDLHIARNIVVAFYNYGVVTLEEAQALSDEELIALGLDKTDFRNKARLRFKGESIKKPGRSRPKIAKQISHRLSLTLGRNKHRFKYDALLTHTWGSDGANHEVVFIVNTRLATMGKKTWFDNEPVSDITQLDQAVEQARKVLVFVTQDYIDELMEEEGRGVCKEIFTAACRLRGAENLIAVVLEEELLDTDTWTGPLLLELGDSSLIDFTTPAKRQENFEELMNRISSR